MLRGEGPLAGPAAPQGIEQAQALVEPGIGPGCGWGIAVERLETFASRFPFRIWPDWNRVEAGVNQV